MNPQAKEFVNQRDEEYTLPAGTEEAFNRSVLAQQRKSLDKLMYGYKKNPHISDELLQELASQEESMNRLERGDPTDALARYQGLREFKEKEPYTRKAFENAGGGKKRKSKKSKKGMKKRKTRRGKKTRSKSMRKRK